MSKDAYGKNVGVKVSVFFGKCIKVEVKVNRNRKSEVQI